MWRPTAPPSRFTACISCVSLERMYVGEHDVRIAALLAIACVARAVRDFEEIASVGLSAVLYEYGPRRCEPEARTREPRRDARSLVAVVAGLADYASSDEEG